MSVPPPLPRPRFFIGRFWRGEVSLAVSYWAVGLVLNVGVAVLLGAFSFVMRDQIFNPYRTLAALVAIWGLVVVPQLFQSVGVWRSAARYRREKTAQHKRSGWGVVAQIMVLLGGASVTFELMQQAAPQLAEGWRMAFEGDPGIPPYSMRLMRDGTEAEITGGFKYGLARDAAKLFASAPGLKVVHLNSGGGRLGEATELAKLIRARGLATYTSASCSSACTIAFAAGRARYLKSGAKLGFHRAVFAGAESTAEMRALLRAAGIEASFVERAVAQPASSIWYPSEKELAAANVILAVVDSYHFAASGLGLQPTLDDFRTALRRVPSFAAMEVADQALFDDAAELYERRYFAGASDGQIADEISATKFTPLLSARLASAPDAILVDYAKLMADQFEALGARDPDLCFEVATKSGAQSSRILPAALQQRNLDLSERVLRAPERRPPTSAAVLKAAALALSQALIARFGVDRVRLLTAPTQVPRAQRGAFCQVTIGMFRAIADLPPPQAGAEMSSIFAAMAKTTGK